MKVSDLYFALAILAVGIFIGGLIGSKCQKVAKKTNQEVTAPKKIPKSSPTKKENWDSIKDQDFEIDMEKMGVILVKRSFNEGDEVTFVQYENGNKDYFVCSREIHHRLVVQFQELLKKREVEGF